MAVALSAGCQDSEASKPAEAATTTTAAPVLSYPEPLPLAMPIEVNGRTGVVDEKGAILIPFENDFGTFFPADRQNALWVINGDSWKLISKDGKKILHPGISGFINQLTPGYFSFRENDRFGIIDATGKIVQPAEYDDIYAGGQREYITYEIAGKRGFMDANGKVITKPLYDSNDLESSLKSRNGLINNAERAGSNWVIDMKTGEEKQVVYDNFREFSEGYAVASSAFTRYGLIDGKGAVVVPVDYQWLDEVSQGLLAFRKTHDAPCGYMDTKGKVVIDPQFAVCGAFGKKLAFVKGREESGMSTRYFAIDRSGKRIDSIPEYDDVGRTSTAWLGETPAGFVSTARYIEGGWAAAFGIFNTDSGIELIAPDAKYNQLSALTAERFIYSAPDAPKFSDTLASVGIVDTSGKVLLKADGYGKIVPTGDGRYFLAQGHDVEALFDTSGRELLGQKWPKLEIDSRLNVIFAYAFFLSENEEEPFPLLRAIYALDGKPIVSVRETECGAEELIDGAGKVIWPQDSNRYCPE